MRCAAALLFVSAACGFAQNPVVDASALLRAGKFAEAHQLLAAAARDTPGDPRLFTLDGFALARLGEDRAAIASYQSALALAPGYLPALEGAAEAKFKIRAPDVSDALTRLLAVRSADPTTHAMLGILAFEHGDCAAAESEFKQSEEAIAREPKSLEARGACLLRLQRPAAARSVFASLVQRAPAENRFRYDLAITELAAGLPREAIAALEAMPSLENDADALDLLADARERCGETPDAIAALRKAIVLHPKDSRLYLHFADVALTHHSFQAGVDMLNAGISQSPHLSSLYLTRGILKVQLAQYAEAEQDFAQAEAIDPSSRYSAALQGMAKLQQNQLAPAGEEIRRRVGKHPDDPFLYYLLAETLTRRGAVAGTPEFAEAVAAARKAVSLQPHFALARDVLGRLYLQKGDTTEAVKQSRLAIADDPTDQTALYHLIRALKKAGQDAEVPALIAKLAQLRTQAQQKEMQERRYAIVVGNSPGAQP